jgi:hypothetical protein
MKTAADYREMAEECFKWASESRTSAVRDSYLKLAQVWLNTASNIDGLPPTRTQPAKEGITETTRAAGRASTTPTI